jgi:hypothetical protein
LGFISRVLANRFQKFPQAPIALQLLIGQLESSLRGVAKRQTAQIEAKRPAPQG